MENKGCIIVTVKSIITLYKDSEKANKVELVSFKEVGNEIIAGIDLYKVGDQALFIQPDYCLSPTVPIFQEYITPTWDGVPDPKKSRLGKNNRVKAIKFNLHRGDNNPVYSYGILIPYKDACSFAMMALDNEDNLDYLFDVIKYEEPEPTMSNNGPSRPSCPFPDNMYKTDETNINNLINDITFPVTLIGTEKVDGSSCTIWYKDKKNFGIASRNNGRPLTCRKVVGRKIRWWEKLSEIISFSGYKAKGKLIYKTVENDDIFVKHGIPYLEYLSNYCQKHNIPLALRGELCGKGMRGSGNPNNPHSKDPVHIEFFGIDRYDKYAEKLSHEEFSNKLNEIFEDWNGHQPIAVPKYFEYTFENIEDLKKVCQDHFDTQMKKGRIIEGIVVKTPDSKWSAKIMHLEYDAKK